MGLVRYLVVVLSITALGSCSYEVTVKQGKVRGVEKLTQSGRKIAAFLGVPYAKPPARFEKSEMAEPWKGIWNATQAHSDCMMYSEMTYRTNPEHEVYGVEDCLYLDVYTPKIPKEGEHLKMSVVIYIHGGAFMFQYGGHLTPKHLLDRHDIVFVQINYRLGILGFLSTGDDVVPGNNGLKDQSLAFRWVHENIDKFGGNPDTITISGSSAGGASVHYHYLSPMSKGLFAKGISFSGSAFVPWGLVNQEAAKERREEVARLIGCPLSPTSDMIECFKSRPARDIVRQTLHLLKWYYNPFTTFGPVIEPQGDDRFISEHPYELVRTGKVQDLPWIASYTKKEGLYPFAEYVKNDSALTELDEHWNEIAPYLLFYSHTATQDRHNEISQSIRKHYLHDKTIKNSINEIVDMLGDRLFTAYIVNTVKLQATVNKSPIYSYDFSYRGKHSTSEALSGGFNDNWGASHGDDWAYILERNDMSIEETEDDRAMSKHMVDMVAEFANTSEAKFNGKTWNKATVKSTLFTYLDIDGPNTAKESTKPIVAEESFWLSLKINELANAGKQ